MPSFTDFIARSTWHQRATFVAHCFKAVAKQHHRQYRATYARYSPADGLVIDAGAHSGQYAKLFAAIATWGRGGSTPAEVWDFLAARDDKVWLLGATDLGDPVSDFARDGDYVCIPAEKV